MKVNLHTGNGTPAQSIDVQPYDDRPEMPNLSAVREAMIAYQAYTEATDIVATIADTGERLARLRFEWLEA